MSKKVQIVVDVDSATGKKNLRDFTGDATNEIKKTEKAASALSGVMVKLFAAFATYKVGAFFKSAIGEQEQLQRNMMRTEQLIKSTGAAAGFSAKQLHEQARALAFGTLQSTEGVMAAQQVLMTFRKVSGDTFTRATELAADLATVTRTDLQSSMTQLGKALEDPVRGINAMTRSGVTFTAQQKETIKSLVETNNIAAAQKMILDELAQQYGGVARAEAMGLAGAQDTLAQAIQEAKIQFIEASGGGESLTAALNHVSEAIMDLIERGKIAEWADNLAAATLTAASVMAQAFYGVHMTVNALQVGIAKVIEGYARVRLLAIEKDSSGVANYIMQAPGRLLRGVTGQGFAETKKDDARAQMEELIQTAKLMADGSTAEIGKVDDKLQAFFDRLAKIAGGAKDVATAAVVAAAAIEEVADAFKAVTQDEMDAWLNMGERLDEFANEEREYFRSKMDLQAKLAAAQSQINDDFEKETVAAFEATQSAWADTVSSMVVNAESFGDIWGGIVSTMQRQLADAMSGIVSEATSGMGALASGIAGGIAGGLASMAVGYIGSQVLGDSGPNPLKIAMDDLRAEVARNTAALKDRTVVDDITDRFDALVKAADDAMETLIASMIAKDFGRTSVEGAIARAPETRRGIEILKAYEQAQATLNKELEKTSDSLRDTIRRSGLNEFETRLQSISDRWSDQLKIAVALDEQMPGANHQLEVWLAAMAETEMELQRNAEGLKAVYAEAVQMASPLSASANMIQAINNRFDDMRNTLRNLGETVTDTTLAAEQLAATQAALSSMYTGLDQRARSARQASWGAGQWQAEESRLMESLLSLDSNSQSYHDDSIDLMERIWDANQQANAISEETASATKSMASGIAKLVSYDEARMGIDDMIARLAGGDLAAVQSREFFDAQYSQRMGAIGSASSPEEAVKAVQDFNQFLPEFLTFMNAYGLDYAGLTAKATSDLQAARAGLPEDYFRYESSAGGGASTAALADTMAQGIALKFDIGDDVSDRAYSMLALLSATFAPDGTLTKNSELLTLKMAADLAKTGDTQAAFDVLKTFQSTDILRPLVVPFAVEFARSSGMSAYQVQEMMSIIGGSHRTHVQVLMQLDWGVEFRDFKRTMQAYVDWWNSPSTWGGVTLSQYTATMQAYRDAGYRDGGISRGPESGHLEMLHGTEAVIPLKNGEIPVQIISGGGHTSGDNKKIESLLTRLVTAVESGRDVTIRVEPDRSGIVRLVADEMETGNPALARGVRNLR